MKKFLKYVLLLGIVLSMIAGCTNKEKEKATQSFNHTVTQIKQNNKKLKESIADVQETISSKKKPLDPNTLTAATTAITKARVKIVKIPNIPSKTEEIKTTTKKLNSKLDITTCLSDLQNSHTNLQNSIKQLTQVTNPSEAFVVERLTGLPNITGMEAVTEGNDPNGNLNKQGGYTSTVYFSSDLVNQEDVFGSTIVDKGTEAGGAIEVYRTEKDAQKRETYLAAFDGAGPFNSGSHKVLGTIVIRTSDKLAASQQKTLEQNITNSFITLK
ncbi:hypothetical protein [Enterococcus columbae]|uniref:Lipoprotein n=1 Tax=Enterococcus columbae DSM 7374 = ATCC 51263 TaxID=1121865 RepID=S0KFS4_9ENTE|nr:hypothetical protein [Enterococcus columbae]EOT43572.1 hypothetical protein OMW_00786 [Enterococcus columbae DSM 7374 = ATCC 51263]EOW87374.1 hypothetical protein I568_00418 [Enterococcus columbae DSM 7374 = ATCC 51263]OJG21540.1 hypothetical protein RR47_GL001222 [Enterococcus columbae DSM 7374 = ATCC 51263]